MGNQTNIPNERGLELSPLYACILGISSMLAVSYSATLSFSIALLFSCVLITGSLLSTLIRTQVSPIAALLCYVGFSTCLVTIFHYALQVWRPELRDALGIYLPLLVVNSFILETTVINATKNSTFINLKQACQYSFIAIILLTTLGLAREFLSRGGLFMDVAMLTNNPQHLGLIFVADIQGFTLAALPAGGFVIFGLIIATINATIKNHKSHQ